MDTIPPVEGDKPPVESSGPSNSGHAATLAIQRGGLKGGKARKDGLVPGSPEAKAADLAKDAERKRKARGEGRNEPPPLPPLVGTVPVDKPQTVPSGPSVVPWNPDTLAPLFKELVPLLETATCNGLAAKADKAGFGEAMVKQVREDARWNETAKAGLMSAGPQVAAKYLSKTGIPADAAPELILGTSIAAIVVSHMMLASKLDQMAKERTDTKPPQNTDNP